MGHLRRIEFALAAAVLLVFFPIAAIPAEGDPQTETCVGIFVDQQPTREQISGVLELHAKWLALESNEARLRSAAMRANLCGADLSEMTLIGFNLSLANLSGINLYKAILSAADLRGANLRVANLGHANLSGANLSDADLGRAYMFGANLSGAKLFQANLSGASLSSSNLSGADLTLANLREANLSDANLIRTKLYRVHVSGANLAAADLAYTEFGVRTDTQLPKVEDWLAVKNLSLVRIIENATTFVGFQRLREDFKKSGMRTEERGVTAALQRLQARIATNAWESGLKFIAFDATSEYGNSPNRPLAILVLGILLFALPYMLSLLRNTRSRGAIWMVWSEDRLLDIAKEEDDKKKREPLSGLSFSQAFLYGLYFSLLSAFHFGWRDLNVGNWISRVQSREYTLRASGWVRVVSGIQSLLSVYLVALWALTQFGRPFE